MMDFLNDSRENLFNFFTFLNRIFLATVEDDQPRLRPVTLIIHEKRFFVTTGTDDNKVSQILENPKVEFLYLIHDEEGNTGYIRGECTAKIIHDLQIKRELFEKVPHVNKLWKSPQDEKLTIFELIPKMYEFMKPGEFHATKIQLEKIDEKCSNCGFFFDEFYELCPECGEPQIKH
jgi:uncharacterized pyridoxamine 5'-phosphate oxidase family protein